MDTFFAIVMGCIFVAFGLTILFIVCWFLWRLFQLLGAAFFGVGPYARLRGSAHRQAELVDELREERKARRDQQL
jgi:hypothetical protein